LEKTEIVHRVTGTKRKTSLEWEEIGSSTKSRPLDFADEEEQVSLQG
jgi:hypothetical protein